MHHFRKIRSLSWRGKWPLKFINHILVWSWEETRWSLYIILFYLALLNYKVQIHWWQNTNIKGMKWKIKSTFQPLTPDLMSRSGVPFHGNSKFNPSHCLTYPFRQCLWIYDNKYTYTCVCVCARAHTENELNIYVGHQIGTRPSAVKQSINLSILTDVPF